MDPFQNVANNLLEKVLTYTERSYAPYSGRMEAVIILLEDGSFIPGVRVENASFQLSISALLNAFTTAFSLGRKDISAVISSAPFSESELAYTSALPGYSWELVGSQLLLVAGAHLPEPTEAVEITKYVDQFDPQRGVELARTASHHALIPQSNFPVGCAIAFPSGEVITGANVEHSDWSQILCAERNALYTAISYGLGETKAIYVSCPKLPGGTPCGACRQVIVELAPHATVWMDLGSDDPASMKATELLPGHFSGDVLKRTQKS